MNILSSSLLILMIYFANNIFAFTSKDNGLDLIHHKIFKTEPGNLLQLNTEGGEIEITPGAVDKVEIKIFGNKNTREKYEFSFDANNQSIIINGVRTKKWSFFSNLKLKYVIIVPTNFNLKVNTAGGDIKVGGIYGEIKLNTSGGDIWADRVSGKLNLNTSGGDIKIYSKDASIIAQTSGGDIDLEYSGTNKGIELRTSGGDIQIKLPSDFDARVELTTSGGDVNCGFKLNNVEKLNRSKIIGDLNNGGQLLLAKTSGGDIEVKRK